ncbi:MAG: hypothetical protein R3B47_05790 [Bacteroidia bacterium]
MMWWTTPTGVGTFHQCHVEKQGGRGGEHFLLARPLMALERRFSTAENRVGSSKTDLGRGELLQREKSRLLNIDEAVLYRCDPAKDGFAHGSTAQWALHQQRQTRQKWSVCVFLSEKMGISFSDKG